jgi:aryl-alcohol dehydrogenase-like predicted oxidoreductase
MSMFLREIDRDLVARVDRLRPLAERLDVSLAQLALAWLLHRDAVTSVIIGATRVEQIDEDCGAAGVELPATDLAAINEIFTAEKGG